MDKNFFSLYTSKPDWELAHEAIEAVIMEQLDEDASPVQMARELKDVCHEYHQFGACDTDSRSCILDWIEFKTSEDYADQVHESM